MRFKFASVASKASLFGSRKFRAYPSATFRISPLRPSFSTFSLSTIRMSGPSIRRERQQRNVPGPLDGLHQLTLMLGASARDSTRKNLPALGRETLEQPNILVIDVGD